MLVQKEAHLLELARYLVLNPVRARMVDTADDWHSSSHHFMLDSAGKPAWLDADWLLGQFGASRDSAVEAYRYFVAADAGQQNPLARTQYQLLLGDDGFASRHRAHEEPAGFVAVCKAQRRVAALTLPEYQANNADREEAMANAYFSTAYTMAEIGTHFGVSSKTVSRAVKRREAAPRH